MKYPSKLQKYIVAAQQGTFVPDRENDELTEALGNPEHPRRTEARQAPFRGRLGFQTQAVTKARRGGRKWSITNLGAARKGASD